MPHAHKMNIAINNTVGNSIMVDFKCAVIAAVIFFIFIAGIRFRMPV